MNPCVKLILCTLSQPVLQALQSLIDAQVAIVQGFIVALTAKLVVVRIALAPLQAGQAIAQQAVDGVRSAGKLIPGDLVALAECADLGNFSIDMLDSLDAQLAEVSAFIADVDRLLSVVDEIEASIAAFQELLNRFTQIQLIIAECTS